MALNILSIPAISAKPERIFLGLKIIISDHRCRLGIKLIKALECLKSWMGIKEWLDETVLVDTPALATAPARGL
jgi:hypothetical protein